MPLAQLITPTQLAERLGAPGLVILDCRFALKMWTTANAATPRHIAGAHFADLERDLSGPVVKGVTGRHPLPDPQRLVERLREWGWTTTVRWCFTTTARAPSLPALGGCWPGWANARGVDSRRRPEGLARRASAAEPGPSGQA